MSEKINYPITVYRVDDCGHLETKTFKSPDKWAMHNLNGEEFTRFSDISVYSDEYSTNYEECKKLAIKRTKEVLKQMQVNVAYYEKQLGELVGDQ